MVIFATWLRVFLSWKQKRKSILIWKSSPFLNVLKPMSKVHHQFWIFFGKNSCYYNVLSLSLLYLSLSSSLFLPFFFSIFLSSLFLSLSLTFLIFSRSFPFPFCPFREEVLWTKFSNLGACQLKFVAVGVKISKFFSKGVLSNNFSALFHEMGPLQTTEESYVKMGLQVFTSPCPMF